MMYVDPEFNYKQMSEIRLGYEHGLSIEQVKIYAKKDMSSTLMDLAREDLENGHDIEGINLYLNSKFSLGQII